MTVPVSAPPATVGPTPAPTATPTAPVASEPDPEAARLTDAIAAAQVWIDDPRFAGIERLHTARDIAAQQGTIAADHGIARSAAWAFHAHLRERFARGEAITTFGPYSPGQAVAMRRIGIEAIYLGGWATSAKGSVSEDPGPDLASYPLSQVPDEASAIVRALLTADRNQAFARSRMTNAQRARTPAVDYRPFIIADADTGHGGDAHVRNLIRRFVEAGVPGYHIEDQRPGAKKCGHQAGKVLVPVDEQLKRLNAARFQLDVMRVPGIIVARTDAESATFLEGRSDERDQPFILGATNPTIPSYRVGFLTILRRLEARGVDGARGHRLAAIPATDLAAAEAWLERTGLLIAIDEILAAARTDGDPDIDTVLDDIDRRYAERWASEAGLMTYGEAIGAALAAQQAEGAPTVIDDAAWAAFAATASWSEVRARARDLGVVIDWDPELPKTPDGYYQVRGGIDYAITRSLAAAPFADLLWMETKTANLVDARRFAEAIHAVYPDKMLAYNLSPSFNWDTTGLTDDEMRRFPDELGRLGFVFDFITYGGHQIDGLAAEEFATALRDDGMLALARLQRRFRLLESPYRTPQSLVGGDRLDAALLASSGRTAATRAMGAGSTQHQHLVQTEVPPRLLGEWLATFAAGGGAGTGTLAGSQVALRPTSAGSDVLELTVGGAGDPHDGPMVRIAFAPIEDRHGRALLSIRDAAITPAATGRAAAVLAHLFLLHRYRTEVVHALSPSEDDLAILGRLRAFGIVGPLRTEVGHVAVTVVDRERVSALAAPDGTALAGLLDALRDDSEGA